MTQAKILIVEDERVVARDIQNRLIKLGYGVVGSARSGEDAIRLAEEKRPDLVLMDIRLSGAIDGVSAAQEIRTRLALPVVYLTAYADEDTLARARVTEPFGYILKPFDERELHTAIEMALYRHQAERRLRASERRFAVTLASIGDGVIATDAQGLVTFMNPVAESLTGWSLADAAGRPMRELFRLVHEQTREPLEDPATRVLRQGAAVEIGYPAVLIARGGREVPIQDSGAPIIDDAGSIAGAVLVFQDVSERRLLEERLRLAQKMEAIGRLAGGVAHDFNNLLTVINGCASMLAKEAMPGERVREMLTEIRRAGERAASLIRQLLVFGRKQPLKPMVIDLNELITELAQVLRWLLGEHIDLTLQLDPALDLTEVEPTQIEQVLMNLATNARDAMPHGGRFVLETRNVELTPSQAAALPDSRPGRYALMTATDTGHGMDEATQTRIFEPFFTTKALGHGSGLGLSLIHGVVRKAGGHVSVSSEVGRGATFSIYLPAAPADERAPDRGPVSPTRFGVPRGTETVLLVDDDEGARELAGAALRASGYTVLEACTGEEALQVARDRGARIDLLLTDLVMPRTTGRELAARLSADHPALKTLFVFESTAQGGGAPETLMTGEDHLSKPFTPSLLAGKVREVLDASRAGDSV